MSSTHPRASLPPPRVSLVAPLSATAATVAVGSSVAASSLLVDYPVLTAQAIRYGAGAALLFAWILLRRLRVSMPTPGDFLRLLALAATGLAAFNVLVVTALRDAEPAAVGVVVGCVPLVLALVGPLLTKRQIEARLVAAAVVVVTGAALVQGVGRASIKGVVLSLGALAAEAVFTLLALPVLPRLGPALVSAYASALASAQLLLIAVVQGGWSAFRLPSPPEAGAVAYLAVVVTAAAFLLWYTAVSHLGAERAGLFAGLVPIAALLGGLVLGQGNVDAAKLAGTLTVAVGVTLGLRQRRMEARVLAEPMPSVIDPSARAGPFKGPRRSTRHQAI